MQHHDIKAISIETLSKLVNQVHPFMRDSHDADVAVGQIATIAKVLLVTKDDPIDADFGRNGSEGDVMRGGPVKGGRQFGDVTVGPFDPHRFRVWRQISSRPSDAPPWTPIPDIASVPVASNDLDGDQRPIAVIGHRESMGQFGLLTIKGRPFRPLLVAPDQIADVFADVLIGIILAYGGGHEIARRAADTDGHGRAAGHG